MGVKRGCLMILVKEHDDIKVLFFYKNDKEVELFGTIDDFISL